MGMLSMLAAFVGGYLTGTKMGDRPIDAAKERLTEFRARASDVASSGGGLSAVMRSRSSVDSRLVQEVMSSPAEFVRMDTPLREAAKAMQRADIGDVLVLDESGTVRGVVTDRDLVIRSVAEGRDPGTETAGQIMSPVEAIVPPTATVSEALATMRRHDVRRLPVVEDGAAVGVVSLGDLSRTQGAAATLADISTAPANS